MCRRLSNVLVEGVTGDSGARFARGPPPPPPPGEGEGTPAIARKRGQETPTSFQTKREKKQASGRSNSEPRFPSRRDLSRSARRSPAPWERAGGRPARRPLHSNQTH